MRINAKLSRKRTFLNRGLSTKLREPGHFDHESVVVQSVRSHSHKHFNSSKFHTIEAEMKVDHTEKCSKKFI